MEQSGLKSDLHVNEDFEIGSLTEDCPFSVLHLVIYSKTNQWPSNSIFVRLQELQHFLDYANLISFSNVEADKKYTSIGRVNPPNRCI